MEIYVALSATILLFSISSTAMPENPKTETIQTQNGPVSTTKQTVDPIPQKIAIVSQKDVLAINALASKAKSFVVTYIPEVLNPSLKDFDEAFHRWQREKNRRYSDQQVIEILGAYLGNQLIADFQMEWVVVTDQYGTDYAVRAKKYEVMSFPFSSVSKRIESNQYDFMVGVYETVKHTIASGDYKVR
jgi:hypothetical protein